MSETGIIIVAGGSGTRMGAGTPKQFLPLAGRPILMHTVERFRTILPDARIVVVLPDTETERWKQLCDEYDFTVPHATVIGGTTRFHSVRNGLQLVSDCRYIGVHDGVRPLVTPEVVLSTLSLAQTTGAAIPATEIVDSLREIDTLSNSTTPAGHTLSHIVSRNRFRAVQTPQFFERNLFTKAYEQDYRTEFTDDASVVEAAGYEVALSAGDYRNIKITTPVDMIFASALLETERG